MKRPAPANEFAPYALGFNHKHLPEMTEYALLGNTHRCSRRPSASYYKGMLTAVPLNLAGLSTVPTGPEQLHAALAEAHFAASTGGFVEVAPLEALERAWTALIRKPSTTPTRCACTSLPMMQRAQAVILAVL